MASGRAVFNFLSHLTISLFGLSAHLIFSCHPRVSTAVLLPSPTDPP